MFASFYLKSSWPFCSSIPESPKKFMVQSLDIYNDCWEIFATYIKYVLRYITNENLTTISYHKNYIYNKMCNLHQEMFRIFQHKIRQKKIKAVLQTSMFVHTLRKILIVQK